MNYDDVIKQIEYVLKFKTETSRIETKSAKDGFPKKCYDTISAFANKSGGIIIFGIDEENDFSLNDVYDINDLQKQITSLCSDAFEPIIRPEFLSVEYKNKKLLVVQINEIAQNKKPCFYKPKGLNKGSYIRVGDRDDVMTDYEIYALQSYNDRVFEDSRPIRNAELSDLNKEKLEEYIEKIKKNKPNFAKNDFNKCLKLCHIIDNNEDKIFPTLAGMLLFGEYPQLFYPQIFVACTNIPGLQMGDTNSLGERFIDNKRVEGTIEEMLLGTMNFLERNMKSSVVINDKGIRIDRTEYPLKALREAVVNALVHRDYSAQKETVYIAVNMYKDRIEIISPGALFGSNKLEKLGTSDVMETRNPTIVKILEENSSILENRHSGIETMRREMMAYGLPEPEFYNERDSFKVIFRKEKIEEYEKNKNGLLKNVKSYLNMFFKHSFDKRESIVKEKETLYGKKEKK